LTALNSVLVPDLEVESSSPGPQPSASAHNAYLV
jgi:hypothetical protein